MKKSAKSTKTIFTHLFSSPKKELLKELAVQLQGRSSTALVFTPNLEQIALANKDKKFAKTLGLADFLLPDGMGLVWGARFLQQFDAASWIAERISGREVVAELLTSVAGQTVLIIGGRGYDALVSAKPMTTKGHQPCFQLTPANLHPDSTLYWTPGFEQVSQPTAAEETQLASLLTQLKPTIVFVALGAPHQEFWIAEHKELLQKTSVRLAMAVGGSFDVIFGKLKESPTWVSLMGLEWLYRLFQQPWRWRRQLQLFVAVKVIVQTALQDD